MVRRDLATTEFVRLPSGAKARGDARRDWARRSPRTERRSTGRKRSSARYHRLRDVADRGESRSRGIEVAVKQPGRRVV